MKESIHFIIGLAVVAMLVWLAGSNQSCSQPKAGNLEKSTKAQPSRKPTPKNRPPNRKYSIHLKVLQRKDSGAKWDLNNDYPEPAVIANRTRYWDESCRDSYICTYRIRLRGGPPWRICVQDIDAKWHDPIGCAIIGLGTHKVGRSYVTIR